jgi:L-lactate dehydrogenase complex protein LldG
MSLDGSDDARRNILGRIRKGLGRDGGPSQAELQSLDAWMAARPRGPLNAVGDELIAAFCLRAQAMQSTTARVAGLAQVAAEAARYLAALGLPASGCVWPALAHLDWAAHGIQVQARAAVDADRLGISGAYAGIAETGTLMVVSAPQTPASVSLLPETHIAVIEAQRIVAHMEDAWALLRSERGEPPRAVNFISGPSRTGDIEQTIVLGAHGPFRVHIIIVG